MIRTLVIGGAALAMAAAMSGAAGAKGWPVASLCGQTHCMVVRHPTVDAFFDWWSSPYALLPAPRPAPYYSIRWHDSDSMGTYTTALLYVRSRHAMRIYESGIPGYPHSPVGPYWRSVPRSAWSTLNHIVARLTAHRVPSHWPQPPKG